MVINSNKMDFNNILSSQVKLILHKTDPTVRSALESDFIHVFC